MQVRRRIAEIGLAVTLFLIIGSHPGSGSAAQSASSSDKAQPKPYPKDYFQRSLELYEFKQAAQSGPERGEEIYYYKCWYCHNEYAKGAVRLDGMYKRPKMISGEPVNDVTVKEKILNGGPGMPAYKFTLSAEDVSDLVSYLRDKCCWDSESPPANPRYRAR